MASKKGTKSAGSSNGAKPRVNKSAWIRSQPTTMPAADVVKKAKAQGIRLSVAQVYTARSTAKKVMTGASGGASTGRSSAGSSGDEAAFKRLVVSIGIVRAERLLSDLKASVGL